MKTAKITLIACFAVLFGNSLVGAARKDNLPASFVDVSTLIPSAVYDMRYYTSNNFVGSPIDGYNAPKCILTKKAAEALLGVATDLGDFGLKLRIFDCYRPQMAVDHFERWALDLADTKRKAEQYPNVGKKDLFKDGYIASRSGHTRGSAVDLTIDGLDMGGKFDYFGEVSHTLYPKVKKNVKVNRLLLKVLMEKHGFRGYSKEWWHFTLIDEQYPKKYFNFVVE